MSVRRRFLPGGLGPAAVPFGGRADLKPSPSAVPPYIVQSFTVPPQLMGKGLWVRSIAVDGKEQLALAPIPLEVLHGCPITLDKVTSSLVVTVENVTGESQGLVLLGMSYAYDEGV